MMVETGKSETHDWPFSRSALTAGLRRYLADPSLRLIDIQVLPPPQPPSVIGQPGTRLRALSVGVEVEGATQRLPLFLKEPPVTPSGRVLRSVGQREHGVYSKIAPHLPVLVPTLVLGDQQEGWIVLEGLVGLRPVSEWTADDYYEAIVNMAEMHDRFHGLDDLLKHYAWLGRPLDADYQASTHAAAEAVRALIVDSRLPQLSDDRYFTLYSILIQLADEIAAPLRAEPATLVHGDYWPGNIGRPVDGRQVIFDWQLAGIGPGILDLVGFVQTSCLLLEPSASVDEMQRVYRQQQAAYNPPGWDDAHFERLWDHALMWVFMTTWLGKLATMPPDDYTRLHEHFYEVWIKPVLTAVERRLFIDAMSTSTFTDTSV
jgi:hypothetical protein